MKGNDLMENVRDFFIEQYEGVENSNSFISFEPMGSMIDPDDFSAVNDEISEIKAREQLSILADRIPNIDDTFLPTISRFSDVYSNLIDSCEFWGEKIKDEDKSKYIVLLGKILDDADKKLMEGEKASIQTPEGDYLPVYGNPKRWYDPKGSFWVEKKFSAGGKEQAVPNKNAGASRRAVPLMWRGKLAVDPTVVKERVQAVSPARVTARPPNKRLGTFRRRHRGPMVTRDARPEAVAAKSKVNLGSFSVSALASRRPVVNLPNAPKMQQTVVGSKLLSGPFSVSSKVPVQREPINTGVKRSGVKRAPKAVWNNLNVLKHLDFAERVELTGSMVKNNTASVAPVNSEGFEMSFDYCIVNLMRPWLNTAIFDQTRLWYSLGSREQCFSTGAKDETNLGILKCLPTAMILIKDLKMRAAWTDEDKQNAQDSVSLGCFNLNNSTFFENELLTPGMQIIGWMCDVIPQSPLSSDPGINFEQ